MKDLERFETEYRESAEEKEDLKKAYLEAEGNMDQILDTVMCAKVEDEARFRLILDKMIKEKEVEKFAAYKKDKKKEEKRGFMMNLMSKISIEPVVILINLGRCMIGVQIANLYIEKTCKVGNVKIEKDLLPIFF